MATAAPEPPLACRYCGLTATAAPEPPLTLPTRVCACASRAHPSCVLRRRASALESYLTSCGRMSLAAFMHCESCDGKYTLPAREQQLGIHGPRVAPYRWRLVLCAWLADALVLCTLVALLELLVSVTIHLALARAIADLADADGSGTVSLEEAVALARSTGDEEGAAALPAVIRWLEPVGKEWMSTRAMRGLYIWRWRPETLARDARTLGILRPMEQPVGASVGMCAEQLGVEPAIFAVGWAETCLSLSVALVLASATYLYVARARRRLATALFVAFSDSQARRLTGKPHPAAFWKEVFRLGRPLPQLHLGLLTLALSAGAQWFTALGAWVLVGRVIHADLLRVEAWPLHGILKCQAYWSRDKCHACHALWPLLGPCARDAAALGEPEWTWAGSALLMAVAYTLDVLLLPAFFRRDGPRQE
ncbi:hypothetical protein T492DRAFT_1107849 [Pavlovales sp. CCMP2436]|nr:hypothetical protein T492DRAFT_1107849 [Pavlovales sp. CCMP2436]